MPFVGTIPGALIKQNVHSKVGDCVDVCSRYHDHGRGSSDDVFRRRTDIDIDLYLPRCLLCTP